jgi:hypothetical protein
MMSALRLQTNLLLQAGRLLLAYNESTGEIHRALTATARALTDETCHVKAVRRRDRRGHGRKSNS